MDNEKISPADAIKKEFDSIKSTLETTLKSMVPAEVSAQVKEAVDKGIAGIKPAMTEKEATELRDQMKKTIEGFDGFQARYKDAKMGQPQSKFLDEAIGDALRSETGMAEIEKALKTSKGSFSLKLDGPVIMQRKSPMTVANTFTGDPVASYNQRQAILPSQKVNFRDLIPTASSPTGLYVTYRENAGETNNIAKQTEAAAKAINDYAFTEVKTVNSYIAGTTTFSKQLIKSASWMQSTLTRLLLRDFYKKENAYFNTTVTGAATGVQSSGTSPDDVKQLMSQIGAILDSDFTPSFCVVKNALLSRMLQSTYTNGYYPGAGAVTLSGEGIRIWGVPVVGASWATANKALIIDSDYLERVEVEGLNMAFSFEEGNNFTKNLVTARVECFEEINLMLAESAYFIDLGVS